MMLISERMKAELEGLLGLFFIGNSILDNIVYQLDVKFVMPNTTNILHLHFSHELPLFADQISDYASDRNAYLHRPVVPANTKEYQNIKEMFVDILNYMVDIEKQTGNVIKYSVEENDRTTKVFLDEFLRELIPYTKVALSLIDYVDMNGYTPERNMEMDAHVNKFLGIKRQPKTKGVK